MSIEALRSIPLFCELDDADLVPVAEASVVRTFSKNSIVITEGDDSSALYVILSGEVRVFVSDEDGRINIINRLGPGDYFGELSLIDDEPRSASVETLGKCRMLVLSRNGFISYVEQHPRIAIRLLAGMGRRLPAMLAYCGTKPVTGTMSRATGDNSPSPRRRARGASPAIAIRPNAPCTRGTLEPSSLVTRSATRAVSPIAYGA